MTDPKIAQLQSRPAKKVKVTLTGPHTHAGKPCKQGDKIEVTGQQRAWLIERGKVAGEPKKTTA